MEYDPLKLNICELAIKQFKFERDPEGYPQFIYPDRETGLIITEGSYHQTRLDAEKEAAKTLCEFMITENPEK